MNKSKSRTFSLPELRRGKHDDVYGNDCASVGPDPFLALFKSGLERQYEPTENAQLGPGPQDSKEGHVRNIVNVLASVGIYDEADFRHAEQFIRLDAPKGAGTPGTKPTAAQCEGDESTLQSAQPVPSNCFSRNLGFCRQARETVCCKEDLPVDVRTHRACNCCVQAAWELPGG